MSDFWDTLAVARRYRSDLDTLAAAASRSMRDTEERSREAILESRELMRKVDALLARDGRAKQQAAE